MICVCLLFVFCLFYLWGFFVLFFWRGGGNETGRERGKQGVARLCVCVCGVCVCVCVHVWMQGRRKDRVRYVIHY